MGEDALLAVITAGMRRLEADLDRLAPFMAPGAQEWMRRLAGGREPEAYFNHPRAFPFVALPLWFERAATGTLDVERHERLAASSIAGYYFIRILDGLVDDHVAEDRSFLPLLGVLHERFQSPYLTLFPAGHPFHEQFTSTWSECLDATARDAVEGAPTLERFMGLTARKVSAARIPLQATAVLLDREDAMVDWLQFFELLGCWHLMEEDLLDFNEDAGRGTCTYVLSLAEDRRREGQSAIGWLLASGIDEISATLAAWMADLRDRAAALGTPEPAAYLASREDHLQQAIGGTRSALQAMAQLEAVLSRDTPPAVSP